MRSRRDRIHHAISFEVLGLLLVTPLGTWLFDQSLHDIGVVTIVSAAIAMAWNYMFNIWFDRGLLRLAGDLRKGVAMRALHAICFEVGLVIILMPFIAWYLDVSLLHALIIDVSFSGFFLVYAFAFNWLYDMVFPIPNPTGEAG